MNDSEAPAIAGEAPPAMPIVVPPRTAWAEAEARGADLVRAETGRSLAEHLLAGLSETPGAQLLALGGPAGSVAIEMARHVPDAVIVCVDSRPDLLKPGRERARELGLDAQFAELDLNTVELEPGAFDLVLCHAVLHRVRALEAVADQVKRALRPGGTLIAADIVARNGYLMWPESQDVARAIFKTLPAKFRLNHTGYKVALIDDEMWQPPGEGFRDFARSQDIMPVLQERFACRISVPYFSLSRRFFDTMYGPNYDLAAPLDRAVFEWIWELDRYYLATGQLRPENFFGIYRAD